MSKRNLLYITFTSYVLFIFLPLMLILYFPHIFSINIPFLSSTSNTSGRDKPVSTGSVFNGSTSYDTLPQRGISNTYIGSVKRALLTSEFATDFNYDAETYAVSFFSIIDTVDKKLSAKDGLVLFCLDPAWEAQNIDLSGLFETYVAAVIDNSMEYTLKERISFIEDYLQMGKQIKISNIEDTEAVLIAIYSKECM